MAAQTRISPVTTWLIVLNIAVFVLDQLLYRGGQGLVHTGPISSVQTVQSPPLFGMGYFSLYLGIGKLEIWRFITFQFLHAGLAHLLLNMIALFFFGPLVESYFGSKRFLVFYFLCGIGGPVAYLILWITKFLIASPAMPLVGASAGIFGILIAAAQIAPEEMVIVYGIIPMKLKTFAWVLLAIAAYTVVKYGDTNQFNAGGQAAHLGGAAVGYLLFKFQQLLQPPDLMQLRRRPPPF